MTLPEKLDTFKTTCPQSTATTLDAADADTLRDRPCKWVHTALLPSEIKPRRFPRTNHFGGGGGGTHVDWGGAPAGAGSPGPGMDDGWAAMGPTPGI
jgi:hypothetical protein